MPIEAGLGDAHLRDHELKPSRACQRG
jgi:hypothetical protein